MKGRLSRGQQRVNQISFVEEWFTVLSNYQKHISLILPKTNTLVTSLNIFKPFIFQNNLILYVFPLFFLWTRYLFSLLQTIDDFITDHHQRLLLVILNHLVLKVPAPEIIVLIMCFSNEQVSQKKSSNQI